MRLHITGLTKTYPNGVKALDNVSLEIRQGMFGLLGPNGAGKSSFMRTLATLQPADEGSVMLDGINVLQSPLEVRKILGYLPQEFGVYPGVSAERLLLHFAVLKGVTDGRKELVRYLLEKVNLYEVRKRNVSSFSGGMRQRFGIAQALLGNPKLIIVDEPTAGLDPTERMRFNTLLSEISADIIVILSTHIVEDVSDLCSRMAILNCGRVVSHGSPTELIAELEGKIWGRRTTEAELLALKSSHNVLYSYLAGGRPYTRIYASSPPLGDFELVSPKLEDLYFKTLAEA